MMPITIIGGGIAGLSLGIGLRRQGVPVTVFEGGSYPRHRVCGEFISGRGLDILKRLGLCERLNRAGAIAARTGKVFLGEFSSPTRMFPQPACCLSRYALDAALAEDFQEHGGMLVQNTKKAPIAREGWVLATGRAPRISINGWKWYGLKVHATGVKLEADLELHAVENGYIGLCNLANGLVDVCGLFRRPASTIMPARPWQEELRGAANTALWRRLAGATFVERTFCSVAGLCYVRRALAPGIAVGDALSMIPPATGNGMSLAIESASLAIGPLLAFSSRQISWSEAQSSYRRACGVAFGKRLNWAHLLHLFLLSSFFRSVVGRWLLKSDLIWNLMFCRTRGQDFSFNREATSGSLITK